jgi:pyrroline-5-carboxylate reductase
MGSALLKGWLEKGLDPHSVIIIDPAKGAAEIAGEAGVKILTGPDLLDPAFAPQVAVMAVKPQAMDLVVPGYEALAAGGMLVLSIAAGTTLSYFSKLLGENACVVRAMPNTPAAVGRGISVLIANSGVSNDQRDLCTSLMSAVGEVAWIDDEALMDAVTAVSGSGPAYLFLLIECLAEAAVMAGLPAALAETLARATVEGASELSRQSGLPAKSLRENVASPGGTTEAALQVLMATDGLQPLLTRAVAMAAARSRELAG